MSKKLIAIMMIATIVFIGTFAACNKDEDEATLYIEGDKYPFVTDDEGNKILDENGEFIVFATDEDGDFKKDEYGNRVTVNQPFEPWSDKGVVEHYYYKANLPENWKIDDSKINYFVNEDTGDTVYINLYDENYAYQDAYTKNYETYEEFLGEESKAEGIKVTWEENLEIADGCMGGVRFTLNKGEQTNVLYLFKHSGNMYKILYESKSGGVEAAKTNSFEFLKYLTYKPYAYYPDVTDANGKTVTDVYLTNGGSVTTTATPPTTGATTTVADASTTAPVSTTAPTTTATE